MCRLRAWYQQLFVVVLVQLVQSVAALPHTSLPARSRRLLLEDFQKQKRFERRVAHREYDQFVESTDHSISVKVIAKLAHARKEAENEAAKKAHVRDEIENEKIEENKRKALEKQQAKKKRDTGAEAAFEKVEGAFEGNLLRQSQISDQKVWAKLDRKDRENEEILDEEVREKESAVRHSNWKEYNREVALTNQGALKYREAALAYHKKRKAAIKQKHSGLLATYKQLGVIARLQRNAKKEKRYKQIVVQMKASKFEPKVSDEESDLVAAMNAFKSDDDRGVQHRQQPRQQHSQQYRQQRKVAPMPARGKVKARDRASFFLDYSRDLEHAD
jgi:hypothetical protein